MTLEHVNPDSLHASPAFSWGVVAPAGRTLYLGGQNGTDHEGKLVEGAAEQCAQAMRNLLAVLDAAGATPSDVVKLTVYLHPDVSPAEGFAAISPVWGAHPTAVTVLHVTPARPGALVEIDAIAVLPS